MNEEIDRLKALQRSLKNKIKITADFDEKEMLEDQVKNLQQQIEMLERFKGKTPEE